MTTRNPDGGKLLTIEEVAERLGVSVRYVRHQVFQRRIAFVKIGRLVRIDAGELEAYIDQARVPPKHGEWPS
jgi:excisionase family DNA binding protein